MLALLRLFRPMSKAGLFYAVKRGRQPGIYTTWSECEAQVMQYPYPCFRKFGDMAEAQAFLHKTGDAPASTSRIRPIKRTRLVVDDTDGGDSRDADTVYCDGACKGNGRGKAIAGIGVWWADDDERNIAERCPGAQTNNRAELIAIIRVLENAPISSNPRRLVIKTDSKYAIHCIKKWLPGWLRNGWQTSTRKPVKNGPLIRYIDALLKFRERNGQIVDLEHVYGHAGVTGNERADALAGQGTTMPETADRDWEALCRDTIARIVPDSRNITHQSQKVRPGDAENTREHPAKRRKRSNEEELGQDSPPPKRQATEKVIASMAVNQTEVNLDDYRDDLLLDDDELEQALREET